ncbi:hypothetical protein GQ42DRAFT_49415 [Ramicandelaber brevisporus]|nr:hypothetical protein GQ42DRAFT_49415 [Ramicandelaber brevisporus]
MELHARFQPLDHLAGGAFSSDGAWLCRYSPSAIELQAAAQTPDLLASFSVSSSAVQQQQQYQQYQQPIAYLTVADILGQLSTRRHLLESQQYVLSKACLFTSTNAASSGTPFVVAVINLQASLADLTPGSPLRHQRRPANQQQQQQQQQHKSRSVSSSSSSSILSNATNEDGPIVVMINGLSLDVVDISSSFNVTGGHVLSALHISELIEPSDNSQDPYRVLLAGSSDANVYAVKISDSANNGGYAQPTHALVRNASTEFGAIVSLSSTLARNPYGGDSMVIAGFGSATGQVELTAFYSSSSARNGNRSYSAAEQQSGLSMQPITAFASPALNTPITTLDIHQSSGGILTVAAGQPNHRLLGQQQSDSSVSITAYEVHVQDGWRVQCRVLAGIDVCSSVASADGSAKRVGGVTEARILQCQDGSLAVVSAVGYYTRSPVATTSIHQHIFSSPHYDTGLLAAWRLPQASLTDALSLYTDRTSTTLAIHCERVAADANGVTGLVVLAATALGSPSQPLHLGDTGDIPDDEVNEQSGAASEVINDAFNPPLEVTQWFGAVSQDLDGNIMADSDDEYPYPPERIQMIQKRREELADGELFVDVLLCVADAEDIGYPPDSPVAANSLLEAIAGSNLPVNKQNCLVYYLLLDKLLFASLTRNNQQSIEWKMIDIFDDDVFVNSSAAIHALTYRISPQLQMLINGYWAMDNGLYERALQYLAHPAVEADWAVRIFRAFAASGKHAMALEFAYATRFEVYGATVYASENDVTGIVVPPGGDADAALEEMSAGEQSDVNVDEDGNILWYDSNHLQSVPSISQRRQSTAQIVAHAPLVMTSLLHCRMDEAFDFQQHAPSTSHCRPLSLFTILLRHCLVSTPTAVVLNKLLSYPYDQSREKVLVLFCEQLFGSKSARSRIGAEFLVMYYLHHGRYIEMIKVHELLRDLEIKQLNENSNINRLTPKELAIQREREMIVDNVKKLLPKVQLEIMDKSDIAIKKRIASAAGVSSKRTTVVSSTAADTEEEQQSMDEPPKTLLDTIAEQIAEQITEPTVDESEMRNETMMEQDAYDQYQTTSASSAMQIDPINAETTQRITPLITARHGTMLAQAEKLHKSPFIGLPSAPHTPSIEAAIRRKSFGAKQLLDVANSASAVTFGSPDVHRKSVAAVPTPGKMQSPYRSPHQQQLQQQLQQPQQQQLQQAVPPKSPFARYSLAAVTSNASPVKPVATSVNNAMDVDEVAPPTVSRYTLRTRKQPVVPQTPSAAATTATVGPRTRARARTAATSTAEAAPAATPAVTTRRGAAAAKDLTTTATAITTTTARTTRTTRAASKATSAVHHVADTPAQTTLRRSQRTANATTTRKH